MTTLRVSDRKHLIHCVLSEDFEPQFLELHKEIHSYALAYVKERHPYFYDLLDDPKANKYLAANRLRKFIFQGRASDMTCVAARPIAYGESFCCELYQNAYLRDANAQSLGDMELLVPVDFGYVCRLSEELTEKYYAIHTDLSAAKEKLENLFACYSSRERFEAYFPLLAEFLPPIPARLTSPPLSAADTITGE